MTSFFFHYIDMKQINEYLNTEVIGIEEGVLDIDIKGVDKNALQVQLDEWVESIKKSGWNSSNSLKASVDNDTMTFNIDNPFGAAVIDKIWGSLKKMKTIKTLHLTGSKERDNNAIELLGPIKGWCGGATIKTDSNVMVYTKGQTSGVDFEGGRVVFNSSKMSGCSFKDMDMVVFQDKNFDLSVLNGMKFTGKCGVVEALNVGTAFVKVWGDLGLDVALASKEGSFICPIAIDPNTAKSFKGIPSNLDFVQLRSDKNHLLLFTKPGKANAQFGVDSKKLNELCKGGPVTGDGFEVYAFVKVGTREKKDLGLTSIQGK